MTNKKSLDSIVAAFQRDDGPFSESKGKALFSRPIFQFPGKDSQ
jgi:hypothetical protein